MSLNNRKVQSRGITTCQLFLSSFAFILEKSLIFILLHVVVVQYLYNLESICLPSLILAFVGCIIQAQLLERTPSLSDLNEIIYGQVLCSFSPYLGNI